MTGSGKTNSKTAPARKAGSAKPARSRTAKSSSSGEAGASRKAAAASGKASRKAAASSRSRKAASPSKAERLSAGGLDPLVLDYLKKHKAAAPHGPGQVAKALGRSSGAVGNCLARLTDAKKTRRVSDKPLRYDLAT
jgi:hypothetical protein